jgi:hypothetical protein
MLQANPHHQKLGRASLLRLYVAQLMARFALEEALDIMFPIRLSHISAVERRRNAEDLINMFKAGTNRRAARRSFKTAR